MKFKLLGDYPLIHDGKTIEPGRNVDMDEEAAASLVAKGRLKPFGPSKAASSKAKEH